MVSPWLCWSPAAGARRAAPLSCPHSQRDRKPAISKSHCGKAGKLSDWGCGSLSSDNSQKRIKTSENGVWGGPKDGDVQNSFYLFKTSLIYFHAYERFACMHLCTMCYNALRGQEKALGPQGLELVFSHSVGLGLNPGSPEEGTCSQLLSQLSALIFYFVIYMCTWCACVRVWVCALVSAEPCTVQKRARPWIYRGF